MEPGVSTPHSQGLSNNPYTDVDIFPSSTFNPLNSEDLQVSISVELYVTKILNPSPVYYIIFFFHNCLHFMQYVRRPNIKEIAMSHKIKSCRGIGIEILLLTKKCIIISKP